MSQILEFGPGRRVTSIMFSGFCKEATRLSLSQMFRGDNEVIQISIPKEEMHGDRLVVTIAQSSRFRLTLKVTYGDQDVIPLARIAHESSDGLSAKQTKDFMREFSNQAVGALKRTIEDQSGYAKTIYPLVTRSEDFSFFSPNPVVPHFEDSWMLGKDKSLFQVSVILEFLDASLIHQLCLPAFLHMKTIGDVEFFPG